MFYRPVVVDEYTALREENEVSSWSPVVTMGTQAGGVSINIGDSQQR